MWCYKIGPKFITAAGEVLYTRTEYLSSIGHTNKSFNLTWGMTSSPDLSNTCVSLSLSSLVNEVLSCSV